MPFAETMVGGERALSDPNQPAERGVPIAEDGPKFRGTDVAIENLFRYLADGWNLHAFLDDFPSVSAEQALDALDYSALQDGRKVFHSDREIVSGTPVFKGTRLMVKNLFDYLEGGHRLDVFLDHFPSADREQAIAALEVARKTLEKQAYETALR